MRSPSGYYTPVWLFTEGNSDLWVPGSLWHRPHGAGTGEEEPGSALSTLDPAGGSGGPSNRGAGLVVVGRSQLSLRPTKILGSAV